MKISTKRRIIRKSARAWMDRKDIKGVDIQRLTGHSSATLVNETLQGKRNNRKVLLALLNLGCPPEFLALPNDMMKAA